MDVQLGNHAEWAATMKDQLMEALQAYKEAQSDLSTSQTELQAKITEANTYLSEIEVFHVQL